MKKRKGLQRIISVILVIALALSSGTKAEAYTSTSPGIGSTLYSGGNIYVVTKVRSEVAFKAPSGGKTSIIIPNTVKIDGITYKVTSISDRAFVFNLTLKKVTIGNNVKTIGDYAFRHCDSLSNVKMGSRIKEIGKSAFEECGSLKSIIIPGGVTKIGDSAFSWCVSLKSITIKSTRLTSVGEDAFYSINSKAEIKVPNRKLKSYKKLLKGKGQDKTVKVVAEKVLVKPSTPKMTFTTDRTKMKFTISWKTVKNASKMEILRATGNGNFKKWKTVSAKKRKVSYSYNLLKKRVQYRFALRAYNKAGKEIKYSDTSNMVSFKLTK